MTSHPVMGTALKQLGSLRSRWLLRNATRVGSGAAVSGKPLVRNEGRLVIGKDFTFGSSPAQSHIVVAKQADASIGARVSISFGAAISVVRKCIDRQ